ncbi:endonuclease/exonuclease/phosphatase family protein [Carboxylicivirga sp. N1Y90]|uniref:endonuclease/exonuclease/phosphatase family protein n=1 Tax=Carboxylicivirga fragile TaxID=3417571 RepID=UPI003D34046B|nr:endonuclease/exonuclease/phosphatase family protein [Marinilabiliaceae bacterium N1Y90]
MLNVRLYIFLLLLLVIGACTNGDRTLNVMSFNIRYDNPEDGINSWSNRKTLVQDFLMTEAPDVIGFQEVLLHQLEDIRAFMPEYVSVAAGRTDGINKGEMTPILFNRNKYELLASSHFWLSDNPDEPGSKSWGTMLPRIVTWIKLKDLSSGYIFYVFNTHLSHVSEYARNQSASLLLEKIKVLAGKAPVVLLGDFNAQPDERMYKTITGHWNNYIPMWDARYESLNGPVNFPGTFNGFGSVKHQVIIDHIFVNSLFSTINFETYPMNKDSVFISDHYPIKAELLFSLKSRSKLSEPKELTPSLPEPVYESDKQVFFDRMFVPVKVRGNSAKIFYTTDSSIPDTSSLFYIAPIELTKTTILQAYAYSDTKYPSGMVSKTFVKKLDRKYKVQSVTPKPSGKYALDNYSLLTDAEMGRSNLDDKSWLGIQGGDVDIVFDFERRSRIKDLHISVLNDAVSWVLAPSFIEVSISDDGINYKPFDKQILDPSTDVNKKEQLIVSLKGNAVGQFVKITLGNSGLLPDNHYASGNPSWLFVDEIVIN